MRNVSTALVIGGGIGGPVAGMALQKAGISASVHEAYDGPAEGVGGLLSIAPNGFNALAVLGAEHVVHRLGFPMKALVMQSWTGKRLAEFGTPEHLPPQLAVWRGDFNRALAEEAASRGVPFAYGKRLVGVEETPDAVTARFADGTSATADILVAADGIRSVTRHLIDPAAPGPRYVGLLGFGAMLPDTGLPPTGGKMLLSFGKRAFLGHQVHDDGSGGWFVNLPRKEPLTMAEARRVDAREWMRVLTEAFAGDRLPTAELFGRTDPAALVVTGGLYDLPRVPTWSRGRTVLVGDAAHATSPSSGQGASMAIESAVVLGRSLRDLPYERAFAAYEEQRRERVERIIAFAARNSAQKAAGPVARVLRDLTMPVVMRMARPESFDWQFDHRVDWDAVAGA
ncbi:FAD-dependent monooxygenase [Phytomonospora sp. NPDC050363]|uniref:FAD-dependent monooxygenase n=1 Tax=Phytomonospora sp. NPDC050363 TaxID=3155642 RepID=UPI0033CA3201